MPVDFVHHIDVLMPEVPRDDFDGAAVAQPQRAAGVAQVVRTDSGQLLAALDQCAKRGSVFGIDGFQALLE